MDLLLVLLSFFSVYATIESMDHYHYKGHIKYLAVAATASALLLFSLINLFT